MLFVLGRWQDALFGFSAIANAVIGSVQEFRAKAALDRLALLNAASARVRRDGEESEIPPGEVVLGDILVLRAEHPLSTALKRKVALFCNVDANAVMESIDVPTIYDLLLDTKRDPHEVIVQTSTPGLDVLPANIDLSAAEVHLVNEVARETILSRVLRQVSGEYDVILIEEYLS